jgi:hypothetical protein
MFVGLESFNPAALSDMHKHQNAVSRVRAVLAQARRHGILVGSGLLLSPSVDDLGYIHAIPKHLYECEFYRPSYICFESPIPGTPNFHRLAAEETPALLPNALLRDFAGFTLVVRPKKVPLQDFVDGYRWLLGEVFTKRAQLAKFADDMPHLLAGRWWFTILCDLVNNLDPGDRPQAHRTYLAGSDTPPPEASGVPFTASDFESEEERRLITEPMRVTDETGRVLPEWLRSTPLYDAKGRISKRALALVGAA